MASLMATLGLDATRYHAEANRATSKAQEAGRAIGSALGEELKDKLMGLASFAFIEEGVRHIIELGEKIDNTSMRLGIGTEAVQQWDFALKLNGSSIEQASKFFEKLAISRQKALQGNPELIAGFQRLGVTLDDLKSKRLEDIGRSIAITFEGGDPQKLMADLRAVGGRGAGELAAAFKAGLANLMDEAPIISDKDIASLKHLADEAKSFWSGLVATVAPVVTGLGDVIYKTLFGIATAFATTGKFAGDVFRIMATEAKEIFSKGPSAAMHNANEALKAAFRESRDSFSDAFDGLRVKEEDEAKRREARKKVLEGGAGDVEEKEAAKERREKEILRLKERAAEIARETALREMTAAERVMALREQINALLEKRETEGLKDPLKAAELDVEIEQRRAELQRAQKDEDRGDTRGAKKESKEDQREHRLDRPERTAAQRIGAFGAESQQTGQLEFARQSTGHLARSEHLLADHSEHLKTSREHLEAIRKVLEGKSEETGF